MNRVTLFDGLAERYGAAAEYPWAKFPDFAVFRHTGNRKWFCLYMPVPSEKLGRGEGGRHPARLPHEQRTLVEHRIGANARRKRVAADRRQLRADALGLINFTHQTKGKT